jgi:hypothetical protein
LTFTSGAIGPHGSVTVGDAFATNNSQTRSSLVTVLDHSNASLGASDTNTLVLDIGTFALGSGGGTQTSPFSIYNLVTTAGYTATLDLISIDATAGNSSALSMNLTSSSFVDGLTAGNHQDFLASLDTSAQGSFQAVYTLHMSDQDLQGKETSELQLTLNGTVLPEPATMTLLGLGGLFLGWSRMRKGRRNQAA